MQSYFIIMFIIMAISLVLGIMARKSKKTRRVVNHISWSLLLITTLLILVIKYVVYPDNSVNSGFGSAIIIGALFTTTWATYPSFVATYNWQENLSSKKNKRKIGKVLLTKLLYLSPPAFVTIFIPVIIFIISKR